MTLHLHVDERQSRNIRGQILKYANRAEKLVSSLNYWELLSSRVSAIRVIMVIRVICVLEFVGYIRAAHLSCSKKSNANCWWSLQLLEYEASTIFRVMRLSRVGD